MDGVRGVGWRAAALGGARAGRRAPQPPHACCPRLPQVGIVSWGVQCGEYDTPGVYGNVASMQVFIGAGARQLLSWQPKGGRRSARELGAAEAAAMEAELAAAAALGLLDGGGAGGAVNSSDVFIHSWSAPA